MRKSLSLVAIVSKKAFAPVDIASLVFFRIAFGALMVWQCGRFLALNRIALYWLEPRFLFKFYGFSWVHPWPGPWLYVHWYALGVFAFFVAIGFLYRASAALLFLSWTYFLLLDEARFINHTYLICLFSFLLCVAPAHRAFSVDAWLWPRLRSNTTPMWTLWLFRLQMGVVYFFAGVAKVSPDWLQGEPMRTAMSRATHLPLIGQLLGKEWAVYAISYSGLLLDLCVVPLLLWRRTRLPAFCLAAVFHVLNGTWFYLGVFPWLAIAATSVFFSPSWPRRALALFGLRRAYLSPTNGEAPSRLRRSLVLSFVGIYAAVQVLLPFHPFISANRGIEWTYAEQRFSWRMMLVLQELSAYFYVTDPNTGKTLSADPRRYLNRRQIEMLGYLPDFSLQFAHYLATIIPRRGPEPLKVEARIMVSINGRKPELYLNPNVDLAAEPRTLGRPRWLLPVKEPLPPPGKKLSGDSSMPGPGKD